MSTRVRIETALVPVLPWRRYFHRGFNPKSATGALPTQDLKVEHTIFVVRIRSTGSQQGLTKSARKSNFQRCIRDEKHQLLGDGFSHVAIIDDVINQTGGTVYQLYRYYLK
ncbi:ComF family protein [Vibrio chagasii]|nr:ComF family protein [Vibrio chagasii]